MGDYVAAPATLCPRGERPASAPPSAFTISSKTMPVVGLKPSEYPELAEAASLIATAEGLTGHGRAVDIRLQGLRRSGTADGESSEKK